jgi:tetratricopeptide (TPR) repeat protein
VLDANVNRTVQMGSWPVRQPAEHPEQQELVSGLIDLVGVETGLSASVERGDDVSWSARDAYLLGTRWFGRRTRSGFQRAIEYFSAALGLDDTYAPAHAGLANAYSVVMAYGYDIGLRGYDAAGRAWDHARQAIELDPEYGPGYAARGYMLSRMFGSTQAAARDFTRALELAPSASQAIRWSTAVLGQHGRSEEALAGAQRSIELDPFSPASHLGLALGALVRGRYDLALSAARRGAELEPEIALAQAIQGRALLLSGRAEECAELDFGPHEAVRAACLRALGEAETAAAIVDSIGSAINTGTRLDSAYTDALRAGDLATYFAWIGDSQRSLEWLEYAFNLSPTAVDHRVLQSNLFDGIRRDRVVAAAIDQITDQIWPRVELHAERLR